MHTPRDACHTDAPGARSASHVHHARAHTIQKSYYTSRHLSTPPGHKKTRILSSRRLLSPSIPCRFTCCGHREARGEDEAAGGLGEVEGGEDEAELHEGDEEEEDGRGLVEEVGHLLAVRVHPH